MKNSKKLIIVLIFLIILGIGIFCYTQYYDSDSTIQVGKTTFKLPEGYKKVDWNKTNATLISDGKNSVFISLRDNDNLSDEVHKFANVFDKDGRPTIITNFSVDNVFVYKLNLENDTQNCYYWFKNNGDVYSVYMWDGNKNIETVVFDLIRSME